MAQQPNQPTSSWGGLNNYLGTILTTVLNPLVLKMGQGWKILTGMLVLTGSWVFRTWIGPKYFPQDGVDEIATIIEGLALSLFGLGVYHRALKETPPVS
jgi:hypothetical protein